MYVHVKLGSRNKSKNNSVLSSPNCDANILMFGDVRTSDDAVAAVGREGVFCDDACRRRVNSAPKISDNEYGSVAKLSLLAVFISFLDTYSVD